MIIFFSLFKVLARAAWVIFLCCFSDPRGLLSRERDMFRRQTLAPGADTNRLLLMTYFWSERSAHNLGMNFIYKGIAVLESKFQFEIKDWDFLNGW